MTREICIFKLICVDSAQSVLWLMQQHKETGKRKSRKRESMCMCVCVCVCAFALVCVWFNCCC